MLKSKRLEAYVDFAEFCNRYQLQPVEVAKVLQLVNELSRTTGWATKQLITIDIEKRLERMGFTNASFKEKDITFVDKFDDRVSLPKII